MKLFRETGSLVVFEKEKRGPKFRFTRNQVVRLRKLVFENPGMNANQLRKSCVSTHPLLLCGEPLCVWGSSLKY
jgi:hypothetical protein